MPPGPSCAGQGAICIAVIITQRPCTLQCTSHSSPWKPGPVKPATSTQGSARGAQDRCRRRARRRGPPAILAGDILGAPARSPPLCPLCALAQVRPGRLELSADGTALEVHYEVRPPAAADCRRCRRRRLPPTCRLHNLPPCAPAADCGGGRAARWQGGCTEWQAGREAVRKWASPFCCERCHRHRCAPPCAPSVAHPPAPCSPPRLQPAADDPRGWRSAKSCTTAGGRLQAAAPPARGRGGGAAAAGSPAAAGGGTGGAAGRATKQQSRGCAPASDGAGLGAAAPPAAAVPCGCGC